jgi:hypothetical protein
MMIIDKFMTFGIFCKYETLGVLKGTASRDGFGFEDMY